MSLLLLLLFKWIKQINPSILMGIQTFFTLDTNHPVRQCWQMVPPHYLNACYKIDESPFPVPCCSSHLEAMLRTHLFMFSASCAVQATLICKVRLANGPAFKSNERFDHLGTSGCALQEPPLSSGVPFSPTPWIQKPQIWITLYKQQPYMRPPPPNINFLARSTGSMGVSCFNEATFLLHCRMQQAGNQSACQGEINCFLLTFSQFPSSMQASCLYITFYTKARMLLC